MINVFKRKKSDQLKTVERQPLRQLSANFQQKRAFSYYANRSTDEANVGRAPDAKRSETPSQLIHWLYQTGAVMALIVLAIILLDELSLSADPKVVIVPTNAGQIFLRDQNMYQQVAVAQLRASFLDRNKLTINTAGVDQKLRQTFPEISAVSVALPVFGHSPIVYIQPAAPSMILVTQTSGSFVLDSDGKALLAATSQAVRSLAAVHVPTVTDQSGLPVAIGQTALPNTVVDFIKTVAVELQAQHIRVSSMTLPRAADELDVFLQGTSFYGRFNTATTTGLQQAGTFIAVMQHLKSQGITPHQYIDVRVDGRAYYK